MFAASVAIETLSRGGCICHVVTFPRVRVEEYSMAVRQRGKVRGQRTKKRENPSSSLEKSTAVTSLLDEFMTQRTVWIAAIG